MAKGFSDRIASESPEDDIFPNLRDFRRDQFFDRLIWILDEALFEQADGAVKFVQFSFDDFHHNILRLAFHLLGIDRAFGFNRGRGHLIAADVEWLGSGDVKGDVFDESTEAFVFGHEIGLAIDLDENADLALKVNVGGDDAFFGRAGRLFAGASDPFGTQKRFGFVEIASGLGQGAFAIHEARVGLLAKLFDRLRINFNR